MDKASKSATPKVSFDDTPQGRKLMASIIQERIDRIEKEIQEGE